MRKIMISCLVLMVFTTSTVISFAGVSQERTKEEKLNEVINMTQEERKEGYILKQHIFSKDEKMGWKKFHIDDISTYEIDPGDGTVMISDEIGPHAGYTGEWEENYTSLDNFLGQSAIYLAKNAPYIGDFITTAANVWDFVTAANGDLAGPIDNYSSTYIQTFYNSRHFNHWLYIWEYGDWKDMGLSQSLYMYKNVDMDIYDMDNDTYVTMNYRSDAFDGPYIDEVTEPFIKVKADNYGDLDRLRQIVEERWIAGHGPYYEFY